MTTREIIKKTAETLMYGTMPHKIMKHVPQGFDLYLDLRKLNEEYAPKVVFDVGANTGQTVSKWKKFFPNAVYHCFEPSSHTMATLKKNTSKLSNVHYHQCALGATHQKAEMAVFNDSTMNSLDQDQRNLGTGKTETVEVSTVDEICQAEKIEHLDFLKIDTEGFDLEVLKGATSLLNNNRITFVQVEAGMNHHNKRHVPLQQFIDFLRPYGYVLFGIYEQHLEWSGETRLRFSNPVFISEKATFKKKG